METLAKIIADGLPPAGASREVAIDHVRQELASWSNAMARAVSELDHCLTFDERQQESDVVADDADPDCTCAYCECYFAQRQVDATLADLKEAMTR